MAGGGDDGIRTPGARSGVHRDRSVILDDVSRAIIEQLQQDGRRSYARIATAVGLSEAAVRQRVQRLLEAGVMQIVAVTDPVQVGFSRQALVGLRVDGDVTAVAEQVAALRERGVRVETGEFGAMMDVELVNDGPVTLMLESPRR